MNRLLILIALFAFYACKEISFREPQPKGKKVLKVIPHILQGKYLTYQENGELSNDTIIITPQGYRFGYFKPAVKNENSEYDKGVLSDSIVLKTYKGYYFLNFNEKPEWILRVIKPEKSGDLSYMALEQHDVEFKTYLKNLSTKISIDSFMVSEEMLYQIDPTPNQIIDLIDKGYFTRTVLKKIQ